MGSWWGREPYIGWCVSNGQGGGSQEASPRKLSLPLEWDPAAESRVTHPSQPHRTLTTMGIDAKHWCHMGEMTEPVSMFQIQHTRDFP